MIEEDLKEDSEKKEITEALTSPSSESLLFRLYNSGEVRIKGDQKIIKSKDLSKLMDIKEVKEEVESNSIKQIKRAIMQASEIRDKSEELGFDRGIKRIAKIIVNQEKMYFEVKNKLESLVYDLAITAVKKIIHYETSNRSDIAKNVVLEAMKLVADKNRIVVFVSKDDKKNLDENKDAFMKFLKSSHSFKIEISEEIKKGGCIIQTEDGVLNATIDGMIGAIEKEIFSDKWHESSSEKKEV